MASPSPRRLPTASGAGDSPTHPAVVASRRYLVKYAGRTGRQRPGGRPVPCCGVLAWSSETGTSVPSPGPTPPFSESPKPHHRNPKRPEGDQVPVLTSWAGCTVLLPPWFSRKCLPRGWPSRDLSTHRRVLHTDTSSHISFVLPLNPHPTWEPSPCPSSGAKPRTFPGCLGLAVTWKG